MAKIILSHFSPVIDQNRVQSLSYYDALIEALLRNGHSVLHLISNDFLARPWNGSNETPADIDAIKLGKVIEDFAPDGCFAFNNSIPDCVTSKLSCPIFLWHGDSFVYFNDKEALRGKKDRYYYVCPFQDTEDYLVRQLGVSSSKILRVLPASGIEAKKSSLPTVDIGFVGSVFYSGYSFLDYLKTRGKGGVLRVANRLRAGDSTPYEKIAAEEDCAELPKFVSEGDMAHLYSSEKRILTIAALAELGLEIYGGEDWYNVGLYHPWIAMAYNKRKVYSLDHLNDIYNSSLVSLNVSHTQATVGFPWRVLDILASNSCLLTDKNLGIEEFTKGYVRLPSYSNPFEAAAQARTLLNDPILRDDIVSASQALIQEKGRWEHRFHILAGVVPLTVGVGVTRGIYVRLEKGDFKAPEASQGLTATEGV